MKNTNLTREEYKSDESGKGVTVRATALHIKQMLIAKEEEERE